MPADAYYNDYRGLDVVKLDELYVSLLHIIIIPRIGNHVYATCVCFAHHRDTPEKYNGPRVRTRSIHVYLRFNRFSPLTAFSFVVLFQSLEP